MLYFLFQNYNEKVFVIKHRQTSKKFAAKIFLKEIVGKEKKGFVINN